MKDEDWFAKIQKLLAGTQRQVDKAHWLMGYKTGKRNEQLRLLQRLETEQVLYWDKTQNVWLNCYTGKPIKNLDWHENNEPI